MKKLIVECKPEFDVTETLFKFDSAMKKLEYERNLALASFPTFNIWGYSHEGNIGGNLYILKLSRLKRGEA